MTSGDFAEQRETLVQSIESDQDDMRSALHELSGVAGLKVDVAQHIRESPLTWAAAAFLLGAWFGTRARLADESRHESRRRRPPC